MTYGTRGKLGLLLVVLFSLAIVSMLAIYGMYWAVSNNDMVSQRDSADTVVQVRRAGGDDFAATAVTSESGVKRLRSLLLSRLEEGETERFRLVFDQLEIAEREGRIDKYRFELIPDILKIAMADGKIDFSEHELILDNLEKTIIPKKGR